MCVIKSAVSDQKSKITISKSPQENFVQPTVQNLKIFYLFIKMQKMQQIFVFNFCFTWI